MSEQDDSSIHLKRRIHPGRLIGKGGMGRVVDGFAADLGQYLAIKILNPEHSKDPEVRSRFEEEASIMASIDHPGNLPVYGTSEDEHGNPCYVMKKVEGRTLSELLGERGPRITDIPHRQHLLAILLDACETVACAHEIGIVHRDLKPANILIDRHDSVFVIDWGLARRGTPGAGDPPSTRTLPGVVMGSPGYMSPEQAEGKGSKAGPTSDVFGLGAILYEILTGLRPFEADESREEMLGTIHKDPLPPRKANILTPRALNEICLKALNKLPEKRYQTAESLATDLRAYLEGRPVSACKPTPIEKYYYSSRRNPLRAAIIGAIAISSVALAIFIGVQVWIDHRLAEKAYDRLETLEVELADLDTERGDLQRQMAEDNSPEEQAQLDLELRRLDTRWALSELEAMRLLSSVGSLRFIRADPKLYTQANERLFTMIETANERGRATFSDGIASIILERSRDQQHGVGVDSLSMKLSDSDTARLEQLAEESSRLLAEQSGTLPRPLNPSGTIPAEPSPREQ